MELAKVLSKIINLPIIDELSKTAPRGLQGKGLFDRQVAVLGLYEVKNPENVIGKDFILIDDVFTSGSTASEIAKILKLAKAKSVRVFVAGRTTYSKGS